MSEGKGSRVAYFGKVPARGDFVRSNWYSPFLQRLDAWITGATESLVRDPSWKTDYVQGHAWHFAILRSAGRPSLAGHLIASRDATGRCFPLGTAMQVEPEHPAAFAAYAPLSLEPAWEQMSRACRAVCGPGDIDAELASLNDLWLSIAPAADKDLESFLEAHTLAQLADMLTGAGHDTQPGEIIMALGLLLEPALAPGARSLERGLILPLPCDLPGRDLVAALWTALIGAFLGRREFDVALCIGDIGGKSRLVVGFQGARPEYLAALFRPEQIQNTNVVLDKAPWSHAHAEASPRLAKLASYLDQPRLSLRTALNTFREVFLGV
jgi:type VI secretion system protein ImpM